MSAESGFWARVDKGGPAHPYTPKQIESCADSTGATWTDERTKQMPNEGQQETQTQQQPANGATPPAVDQQASAALATVPAGSSDITSPFSGERAFVAAQRMATALAKSTLVPQVYRNDIANCLIAMELASRIGVSVLAAMQNLDIIQGKPSWSSKFLIATVNASGRFTPLRFEWAGEPGKDSWACRAHAADKASGELCVGTWITWLMAKKEGWTTKNGSKWQTMPEQMFQYRAAAFWTRVFCPEISIGFQTTEEAIDQYGQVKVAEEGAAMPTQLSPGGAASLAAVLGMQSTATDAPIDAVIVDDKAPPAAEPEPAKAERRGAKSEQQKLGNDK